MVRKLLISTGTHNKRVNLNFIVDVVAFRHPCEELSIRGSMTLREVEEATGVPSAHIKKSLKISDTEEERLGPLRRQYGFEINDVREIVKTYNDSDQ
jgi:hypothetical protein